MPNPAKKISLTSFAKGLLTFLLVATVIGGYFFFQKDARQQAVARAQENLQSIAYALSIHVDGTLEQADHIGRVMRHHYVKGKDYAADARAVYAELDSKVYLQLGIIDAKGMSIFGTLPDFKPVDLSDRKHFRVHADGKGEDVLFVSAPLLGRSSKKLTLQLSRSINSKDGKFLGVTVVSINPEEFTGVYRKLLLKNGIIALNGFDGINRIRVDSTGFNFGNDISNTPWFKSATEKDHGFVSALSVIDGVNRLTAFRRVGERNLFVTVGAPYAEIEPNYLAGYHIVLPWITAFIVIALLTLYGMSLNLQNLNTRLEDVNQQLVQNVDLANEATAIKSQFLASVSHELRTPLHGILGHAELLSLEDLPVDAKKSVSTIFQSANHLLNITNQLLDIAKSESGEQQLDFLDVEIRTAVMEVITLHQITAQQRGGTITCTIDDSVPSLLNTDATALKRILHNLVDNGLKFSKATPVQVDVSRNGEFIRFAVTDSGVGISPKNQKKLFVNYVQVHEFETREVGGTGLGLALTRSLVELLGGNIGVQSSVGKGSTFWFNLPLGIRPAGQHGVGS